MAIRITLNKIKLVRESSHLYDIDRRSIHEPEDAVAVVNTVLGLQDEAQEVVCALYLTTANTIAGIQELYRGTLNASFINPKEVFKAALLHNAASLILCHNHPSGSTDPSREDLAVTDRISKSGKILDIHLLDHIIIGAGGDYRSLKAEGMVE